MADERLTIGHASISETGTINGQPGDSTGKEVCRRTWYSGGSSGWHTVLRPNRELLAQNSAIAVEQACDNDHVGYSQYGTFNRNSLWTAVKAANYVVANVTTGCNCDCSSLMHVAAMVGGCANLSYSGNAVTTTTIIGTFTATGEYYKLTDSKYLTSDKYLQRGDILVKNGHVVMVLLNGSECDPDYAMDGASDDSNLDNVLAMMGALYDVEVTKDDAVIREVGYLNSLNQPSILPSNITLSVINYTDLLGELFAMYIPDNVASMTTEAALNIDLMGNTTAKAIMRCLLARGLNFAAVVGITANIYHESSFNPGALGDYRNGAPTSFGLCQWHNARGTAMKQHANPNWANNVSGQMSYLMIELNGGYKRSTLDKLMELPNTLEGAKKAADIFVRNFEIPAEVDKRSAERQATAAKYWEKIVIQQV